VAELARRTACPFPDAALALAALTHKSFVNEHRGEGLADNERLEFLGDAVIDLAVSHRLMERFPEAREGELSKIRAALVDEPGLARLARQLDLGPLLRLGRGEELTGGREKASLLADALEAVVAVVYLGGGLAPVLDLLDRMLAEAFERAASGTLDRDYKTQLQELSQSRMRAAPRYRVVSERGPDHEKTFEVELEVRGEALGRGEGRSKKDAEQAAARVALEVLGARIAAGGLPEEGEGQAATPAPTPTAVPAPTPTKAPTPSKAATRAATAVPRARATPSAAARPRPPRRLQKRARAAATGRKAPGAKGRRPAPRRRRKGR
jgi:ribonuclease-3